MTSFWYLFTSPAFLGPLKREKPPPWVFLHLASLLGLVKTHIPSKVTISENQKTRKSPQNPNSLQPKKFCRSPVSTTTQAFLLSLLCGQPLITATSLPFPTAALEPNRFCCGVSARILVELHTMNSRFLCSRTVAPIYYQLSQSTFVLSNTNMNQTRQPKAQRASRPSRVGQHPRRPAGPTKYSIPVMSARLQQESLFQPEASSTLIEDPDPALSLVHDTYSYVFPLPLRAALLARIQPDPDILPVARSILLHGIPKADNVTHARAVLQQIINRLDKANIQVHRNELQISSASFLAIQKQASEPAILHGTVGSTKPFLSLILDLKTPHRILEALSPAEATLPRSLFFRETTIKKNNSFGRQTDLTTAFSMTPQYTVRTKDMWMSDIDGTHHDDVHFRPILSLSWLHGALDFLAAPLMLAMSSILADILSPDELAYTNRHMLIHPSRPFLGADPNTEHLTGRGFTLWLRIDVTNPLHTTTRLKLLAYLLGEPKTHRSFTNILGTPVVFYQPHPSRPQEPYRLHLGSIPSTVLSLDTWFINVDSLPPYCDTHTMLLILTYGFGLAPSDILNVFHEYDQLNSKESITRRNSPRTVIQVASDAIARSILAARPSIVEGIIHILSDDADTVAMLRDRATTIYISSRNTPDHPSLPQLQDSPLRKVLHARIAITRVQLNALRRSTDLPIFPITLAPWHGVPPDGLLQEPLFAPLTADSSAQLLTGHSPQLVTPLDSSFTLPLDTVSLLPASPPRSTSSQPTRDQSPPKRTRPSAADEDTRTPCGTSGPPVVTLAKLSQTLQSVHNLAMADPSHQALDAVLNWNLSMLDHAFHQSHLPPALAQGLCQLAHCIDNQDLDFQVVDSMGEENTTTA
jgi:hypothetical protein